MASILPVLRRRWTLLLIIPVLLLLPSCGNDKGEDDNIIAPPRDDPNANEIVGQVAIDANVGAYVDAQFPTGTTAAPLVLGASQYIAGASIVLEVTVDDAATQLLVGISLTDSGYWTVDLAGATASRRGDIQAKTDAGAKMHLSKVTGRPRPELAAARSQSYILTITPVAEPVRTSFTILLASGDGTAFTSAARHAVRPNETAAGSSELQVSLNWSHPVDMDLHVETPEGEDIYWFDRQGSTGGELDLDSNAACAIDNVNNENITWRQSAPTAGTYTVRVNLWSACAQSGPFPFVVTTIVGGQPTLHQGSLTLADEYAGGEFDGNVITQFAIGPAAQAPGTR